MRQPDEPPDVAAQVIDENRLRLVIEVVPDREMAGSKLLRGSVEQVLAERAADRAGRAVSLFQEIVERSSECAFERDDGVRNFEVGCEVACVFDCLFAVAADAFVNGDRNDFYLPAWREDLVQEVEERGAVLAAA